MKAAQTFNFRQDEKSVFQKEEPTPLWKLLGFKTHSKRSIYGHHFRYGVCLYCGLSLEESDRRFHEKEAQHDA